eukprot:INCI4658.1.p1 GENE.INCI4658.1~~INCI4658.1.p1  ORF type:complete len:316 (-),score=40.37 INCI4658.1:466-1413(-)
MSFLTSRAALLTSRKEKNHAQKVRLATVRSLHHSKANFSEITDEEHGRCLLHEAAVDGDVESVKAMISAFYFSERARRRKGAGADLNQRDVGGNTALMLAAERGFPQVIMVLAAGKADVNARDPVGRTALIAAAKTGKGEAIKALVLCKAVLNTRTRTGVTALHLAAEWNQPTACELLVQAKADLNVRDSHGRTPTWIASAMGREKAISLFIAAGANVHSADKHGRTPHDVAQVWVLGGGLFSFNQHMVQSSLAGICLFCWCALGLVPWSFRGCCSSSLRRVRASSNSRQKILVHSRVYTFDHGQNKNEKENNLI